MLTRCSHCFGFQKFIATFLFIALCPFQAVWALETGVVILAAGLGSRMQSDLPKVLHTIKDKPMIFYVLDSIKKVSPKIPVAVVVGYRKNLVVNYIRAEPSFKEMNIVFVDQPEQLGTGHAARCAMDSPWGEERLAHQDDVLVLPGDMPLLTAEMVAAMISPLPKGSRMKLMTTVLEDPTGYGRIVRDDFNSVLRIVEQKDANPYQKEIREVGVSIYTFEARFLRDGLHELKTENAQKEFYLTDLVAMASEQETEIPVVRWERSTDLRGVNTVSELEQATQFMLERLAGLGPHDLVWKVFK